MAKEKLKRMETKNMDEEEFVEVIFQKDLKIKKLKEKLKMVKEIAGSSFPDDAIYKIQELLKDIK